ncbi:hypothetical protein HDR60_01680 [bacterium]|nr:hypothetical protein [bacterium]
MNNVNNTNKEEIKYLTYEDVKRNLKETGLFDSFDIKEIYRDFYSYNDLMEISEDTSKHLLKEILQIEDEDFSKIILDFAGLIDTNEKYVVIDALLSLIKAKVVVSFTTNEIKLEGKKLFLSDTLKVFNSIKNNNAVLKSIVNNHKSAGDLLSIFLNISRLYKVLLSDEEFMKQAKNYNKVVDMFPKLKDNQR